MNRALASGCHVRAEGKVDDSEVFGDKMKMLAAELRAQPAQGATAEGEVAARLKELGHGV